MGHAVKIKITLLYFKYLGKRNLKKKKKKRPLPRNLAEFISFDLIFGFTTAT